MSNGRPILHQFTEAAMVGDATTDQALLIRRWLRELGFISNIYAIHRQPAIAADILPMADYRPGQEERFVIYHHAIGTDTADKLLDLSIPLILIYHNITPPDFFTTIDPLLSRQLVRGLAQLEAFRPQAALALGDSYYSERELLKIGFRHTGVLPIVLDSVRYDLPSLPALADHTQERGPLLLFVGRLAPNKRQEDLLKLLHFYRRIEPNAELILVGGIHHRDYYRWLLELAGSLNLDPAVTFAGHVSHEVMVSYYHRASVFVCMSEHEGFGKPLIESMYLGLPVLAFASTAIPETMGKAGILFHRKDYEVLAEAIDILVKDGRLRAQVVEVQKQRAKAFLEPQVRERWHHFLQELGVI